MDLLFRRNLLPIGFLMACLGTGSQPAHAAAGFTDINHVSGMELFQDPWLWDDSAKEAAGRLRLRPESQTSDTESYRLYPRPGVTVLQTHPYSMALYGRNGQVERLSLVFANKGDFPGFHGKNVDFREAAEKFQQAMERDEHRIHQALSHALGPPRRQLFGEGNFRERVWRWDWNGHAFILRAQEGEYVAVAVMTSTEADQSGRAGKTVSDAEVRRVLKSRVDKRPNGDVIITDIPMVDQGPKGYCGPATWERYLRYLGIPADMYILANAAQAKPGGGTNPELLAASVYSYVRQYGRKPRPIRGSVSIKYIRDYIDDGLPIMWNMVVDRNLNRIFSIRSQARKDVDDWSQWRRVLETSQRQTSSLEWDIQEAHTCMIIGYNPLTEEICISDSWGSHYEERWILEIEAEKISLGSLSIIQW
jgi:hypothetical protein